jgi:hypothetical protein
MPGDETIHITWEQRTKRKKTAVRQKEKCRLNALFRREEGTERETVQAPALGKMRTIKRHESEAPKCILLGALRKLSDIAAVEKMR